MCCVHVYNVITLCVCFLQMSLNCFVLKFDVFVQNFLGVAYIVQLGSFASLFIFFSSLKINHKITISQSITCTLRIIQ